MTCYPPDAVALTQVSKIYLQNPLYRIRLARLLGDAANQQAAL